MDRRQNTILTTIFGGMGLLFLLIYAVSRGHYGGGGLSVHSWSPTAEQKKLDRLRHMHMRRPHH